MSKTLDREEVIQRKKNAIRQINNLCEGYIKTEKQKMYKKCNLLTYWLQDYTKYIKSENKFNPKRLKAYNRGDIVKLNFGFNVGSEQGGLHYAIVINNNNPQSSSVLTVIPLTSLKKGKEIHKNDVFLGDEIYRNLKLKFDTLKTRLNKEISNTRELNELSKQLVDQSALTLENIKAKESDNYDGCDLEIEEIESNINTINNLEIKFEKKISEANDTLTYLKKVGAEIARMKEGSIALVEQITTVSKMRIYDPRNQYGVLDGVKLTDEAITKVNDKLKELFIF